MVTSFKHLNFICPFTCLSGYNSDTITELERKCRRLQTQVFQMEVQWNTVLLPPPPPSPVYTTTSLLRQYSFDPNVKTTESFYYFKYPVNTTISLLPSGFIVQRWSHQQGSIVVGIWSWLKLRKLWLFFWPSFESVLVMVCLYHPTCLCLDSEDDYSTGCRNVSHCQQHSTERTDSTYLSSDFWLQTFHSFTFTWTTERTTCKPQKLWHWRWLL